MARMWEEILEKVKAFLLHDQNNRMKIKENGRGGTLLCLFSLYLLLGGALNKNKRICSTIKKKKKEKEKRP